MKSSNIGGQAVMEGIHDAQWRSVFHWCQKTGR